MALGWLLLPINLQSSHSFLATPSTGFLLINFDASIEGSRAAAGFVIRDFAGSLIRADDKLQHSLTVPYAALIAT